MLNLKWCVVSIEAVLLLTFFILSVGEWVLSIDWFVARTAIWFSFIHSENSQIWNLFSDSLVKPLWTRKALWGARNGLQAGCWHPWYSVKRISCDLCQYS